MDAGRGGASGDASGGAISGATCSASSHISQRTVEIQRQKNETDLWRVLSDSPDPAACRLRGS